MTEDPRLISLFSVPPFIFLFCYNFDHLFELCYERLSFICRVLRLSHHYVSVAVTEDWQCIQWCVTQLSECLDCGHVICSPRSVGDAHSNHRGGFSHLRLCVLAKGLLTLAVQSDISVFPLTLDSSYSSVTIPLSEVKPLPKPLGLSILRNRRELLDGICNLCILLPVCLVAHPPRHK